MNYAKGMLASLAFVACYAICMSISSVQQQGVLLLAQGVITAFMGVLIYHKGHFKGLTDKKLPLLISLVFFLSGFTDIFWAISYYIVGSKNVHKIVPFIIELGYALCYLSGAWAIYRSFDKKMKPKKIVKIFALSALFTLPIVATLIMRPLFFEEKELLFYLGEFLPLLASFVFINLCFVALISSRELFWGVFSSGMICFIFSEWSIRFNKIIGLPTHFGYESFFLMFGLYVGMVPFFVEESIEKIENTNVSSISFVQKMGTMVILFSTLLVIFFLQEYDVIFLKHMCIGIGVGSVITVFLNLYFINSIKRLSHIIDQLLIQDQIKYSSENGIFQNIHLAVELRECYEKIFERILSNEQEKEKNRSMLKIAKMASQVSHDIKSPLAVLNMMLHRKLDGIEEEDRVIIRGQINRIQDIANNLSFKNVKNNSCENIEKLQEPLKEVLLSSAIEDIITEKRIYFRSKLGVNIDSELYTKTSYGLFATIDIVEFKRILSNLINNAVEAFQNNVGKITIKLQIDDERIESVKIVVSDNGKGIPAHIIGQLGEQGASFGKEKLKDAGSGLGLYHAKTTITEWGGHFELLSQEGVGTDVIIRVPKAPSPSWFFSKIRVDNDTTIVIADDDHGIHVTWDNRFKQVIEQYPNNNIQIVHLSTTEQFKNWVESSSLKYKNVLYLSDFEFIGCPESGLDVIESYKLSNAVLVTSYYEEEHIRERCQKLGVKLLPKMLAGFIPFEVKMVDNKIYDLVYIEDDPFLRKMWNFQANKQNLDILTLSSTSDFFSHISSIDSEKTKIFLDSDLGIGEVKGEHFAQELYKRGYRHLYMATGHDAEAFTSFPWLKVVEKDYLLRQQNF